jgi:hypothetical protein
VRWYAALFAIGLVVYGALAWDRLGAQSVAPHFVYQADAWLRGHAWIEQPVPGGWGNDWARVETVELDDGSLARGRFTSQRGFRTLAGDVLPPLRVRRAVETTAYMSFPPLPAILMIPSAAISGRAGSDMIPNLLVAALILPLALLVLRRLAAAKLLHRSERDQLWLVGLLGFGTVLFYVAVQGSVWHFAHVCGVALALVYVWASIESSRPLVAGLALGAAALTRTPMAFLFPLFVLEAWRIHRSDRRMLARKLIAFAVPVTCFAIAGVAYNYVRFGSPLEFGHTYLDVRQQAQIEQYGLFSTHYLVRNLAVALLQLPIPVGHPPWLQVNGHGLALWVTTPALLLLCSRRSSPLRLALWITCACVALPSLLYQNSGWVQFGYRFSLDYIVLLFVLIAACGRPLTRVAKALILASIAINLAGALVFARMGWRYFQLDYDHVKILGGVASVDH